MGQYQRKKRESSERRSGFTQSVNFAVARLGRMHSRATAKSTAGFTLVEMLVAVGIFTIVMVVAVSSLISLLDANRRAQSIKSVTNNVAFAIESMARTIRTGTNYWCGFDTDPDCPNGDTELHVLSAQGEVVTYEFRDGQIFREDSNGTFPITPPEIQIGEDDFRFYVTGARRKTGDQTAFPGYPPGGVPPGLGGSLPPGFRGDDEQPRAVLVLEGRIGEGVAESVFRIHTSVTQRVIDF